MKLLFLGILSILILAQQISAWPFQKHHTSKINKEQETQVGEEEKPDIELEELSALLEKYKTKKTDTKEPVVDDEREEKEDSPEKKKNTVSDETDEVEAKEEYTDRISRKLSELESLLLELKDKENNKEEEVIETDVDVKEVPEIGTDGGVVDTNREEHEHVKEIPQIVKDEHVKISDTQKSTDREEEQETNDKDPSSEEINRRKSQIRELKSLLAQLEAKRDMKDEQEIHDEEPEVRNNLEGHSNGDVKETDPEENEDGHVTTEESKNKELIELLKSYLKQLD